MKRDLRLFIDGNEVELQKNPNILLTYAVDDVVNPTAVKNTFSKTVEIPGTKNNNRIFNEIFNLDRTGFDGGKKIPFQIFVDHQLYEEGYCRLDKINNKLGTVSYSLSFFGGLGSLFYNLSFKEDELGVSNKRTLADLIYRYDGSGSTEVDLDFTINKDTLKEAWDNVQGWSTKWRFLNFAPAYNGLPDDFDTDKALVQVTSTNARGGRRSEISNVVSDGKTYAPYGGYILAELDREYVESEMREFRSYLQRPVVRCMEVIKACCEPENNGGYQVNLDPKFFNANNPYWFDTWCTLPMLTSFDYIGQEETTAITLDLQSATAQTTGYTYVENRNLLASDYVDSVMSVSAKVNLEAVIPGATADAYYPTAYSVSYNANYYAGIIVQLVAYDAFGKAVAGSNPQWLDAAYGARRVSVDRGGRTQIQTVFPKLEDFDWTAPYGSTYDENTGGFYLSGGTYTWQNYNGRELRVTANNIPVGSTLRLEITKIYKPNAYTNTAMALWQRIEQGGEITQYYRKDMTNFNVSLEDVKVSFASNETIRTNSLFTKKTILSTDYTPCDFLLSYCKLFGLYFRKDPDKREVDILTRENFFSGGTENIEKIVDRQDMQVAPVAFQKKWYKYSMQDAGSEYAENYKKVYGKDYGQALVDTGYQFNTDTEDLFKDNIFKSAVQCTEKSNAYSFSPENPTRLPYTFYAYTYLLFNEQDATDTYEVQKPAQGTFDAFSGISNALYFDLFSKVQLHTADNSASDGGNVLLLFSGMQDLSAPNGSNLGYYITDDNSYMNILNDGTPCWLYTRAERDAQGNDIAIHVEYAPRFGRYNIYQGSGYITKSLDFGEPETLYIPAAVSTAEGTMYDEFWKDYISDLYHIDTRIVTTKVLMKDRVTVDDLRKFYVFDNSLWRLSKISDWNISEPGLTTCEFVKVNNPDNYKTKDITNDPALTVTLSKYTIAASGETITFSVATSDGGAWYAEVAEGDDNLTITPDSADAPTGGTITIGYNTWGGSMRDYVIWFFADPASVKVVITQEAEILYINMQYQGNVPASGATVPVQIIADNPWTASCPYNWVTLTQTTGDSGTTNTSAVWAPNTDNTYREAYLTISSDTRTSRSSWLRQDGENMPYTTIVPTGLTNYSYTGGTFEVEVTCSEDWVAYLMPASAINASPISGQSGVTMVTVTVQPNDGPQRTPVIQFQGTSRDNHANLYVFQQENPTAVISISPQTVTGFTQAGGQIQVQVSASTDWTGYHYTGDLMASPYSGTSGVTMVTMTVASNTTGADRTLKYNFHLGQSPNGIYTELTVQQNGNDTPSESADTFFYQASSQVVPRTSNDKDEAICTGDISSQSTMQIMSSYTAGTAALNFQTFKFPSTITQIGCLWNTDISYFQVYADCKSIGKDAFALCTSLTQFDAPGVVVIKDRAFMDCSRLNLVVIPATCTTIGDDVFSGCTSLANIAYEGTMAQLRNISFGTDVFSGVPATVIQCSDGDVQISTL